MLLYVLTVVQSPRRAYACALGLVALCFALLPWYPSGLSYFVFGCVMLQPRRGGPLAGYLLVLLALNALLMGYALFIGYPWHLKGVDVLIRAFQRVADRHPTWRLRILGHCPDRAPWEALRAGHPRIEFLKAMKHDRAMELLGRCAVFVLPSRTEAMGRVIVEAMAAGKPVIASAVDGIPHYVRDGDTGLLFASESVDELADRLDRLMSDPAYAAALAARGQAFALSQLSESRYVEQFRELVEAVTADAPEPVPLPASHGALL